VLLNVLLSLLNTGRSLSEFDSFSQGFHPRLFSSWSRLNHVGLEEYDLPRMVDIEWSGNVVGIRSVPRAGSEAGIGKCHESSTCS